MESQSVFQAETQANFCFLLNCLPAQRVPEPLVLLLQREARLFQFAVLILQLLDFGPQPLQALCQTGSDVFVRLVFVRLVFVPLNPS